MGIIVLGMVIIILTFVAALGCSCVVGKRADILEEKLLISKEIKNEESSKVL